MTPVFALLGATALYLTFAWLASAIVASYLSERKGYGQRLGLAAGLLLTVLGPIIMLLLPPKCDLCLAVLTLFMFGNQLINSFEHYQQCFSVILGQSSLSQEKEI